LPDLVRLLAARGARRVWLFGSLAWGETHETSDIDLAVEGLPLEELGRAQGELLLAAPCKLDLVRLEEVPEAFASRIRQWGIVLDE
jgi:predicted nucleotidyltransferase